MRSWRRTLPPLWLSALALAGLLGASSVSRATAQSGSSGTALYLSTVMKTASGTVAPTPTPVAPLAHIAVIGDSEQDEYQAPENARPALNWVELLARLRALPVGPWGQWGGSRRTGYEFDWALSGATSSDALANQVPGVVAQLKSGTVSYVLLQVGVNDFRANGLSDSIYRGLLTGTAPLDRIADNIIAAAAQLDAAKKGSVLVAATQDYIALDLLPDPQNTALSSPVGRQRLIAAFTYVNDRVRIGLQALGISWWDFNAAFGSAVASRRQGDQVVIDGLYVNIRSRGAAPTDGSVDDAYMHPGTALSGLFASVYINRMNDQWNLRLAPLTDAEIRAAAIAGP